MNTIKWALSPNPLRINGMACLRLATEYGSVLMFINDLSDGQ